jgi:hypothetical protein
MAASISDYQTNLNLSIILGHPCQANKSSNFQAVMFIDRLA